MAKNERIVWKEADLQLFHEAKIDVNEFPDSVLLMLQKLLSESKKRENEFQCLVTENKNLQNEVCYLRGVIDDIDEKKKVKEEKKEIEKGKEEKKGRKEKEKRRESTWFSIPPQVIIEQSKLAPQSTPAVTEILKTPSVYN